VSPHRSTDRRTRANRYEDPPPASREELESAVATGDPAAISRTIIGVLEDGDPIWLTDRLLDLTRHESTAVRATAITSLGHVARIYGQIDRGLVLSRLRELRSDPLLIGRVDDAVDDIDHFTPSTDAPDPGESSVERPDVPSGRGLHRRPHQDLIEEAP
jgi:hypothetical protein